MRATTGGKARPKPPRPYHVAGLRRADKIEKAKRARLDPRQQRIVKLARTTVTAKPHQQKRIAQEFERLNLSAGEKRLANRAATQHGEHLRKMQPGFRETFVRPAQKGLETVGLGGAAHPIRRLQHPGGEMMFPGFGKNPARLLGKVSRGLVRGGRGAERAAKTARRAAAEDAHNFEAFKNERGYWGIRNRDTGKVIRESAFPGDDMKPWAESLAKRVTASSKRSAAREARAQGAIPKTPKTPKTTRKMAFPAEMPEDVRASAHRLAHGLDKPQIKALRAKQEKLYSAERGKRAKVAEAALTKHAGTPHAIRIAKSKLAGELPKVNMRGALGDLGEQDVNHLRRYVHTHRGLGLFDKINVEDALERTIAGRPPTESERLLLHRVFGKEFVNKIEQPTLGTRLARGAAEVANVPRSLESSFDVSAPLRQGLVALARHPAMTSKNVGPMLGAFRHEGKADAIMAEIARRPNYQKMRESGLAITDPHSGMMADREEFFPSNLAERIPVAGRGVKASGRAYHGFLSKTRADLFDKHIAGAAKAGYDADDPELLRSLSTFINAATGRGDIGKLAPAARALSATFFSPRLLASRLNFLNPVWYARLHPYARRQALRSVAQLAAFTTGILALAHEAGADVETDPRSTDWAKIRVGDTRIDLLGGFQPVIRTAAQMSSGSRKTARGEIVKLGHGPGEQSRLDIGTRFLRGKLAPVPSLGADLLAGETFTGDPVTPEGEAWQRLVPFGFQDATDTYRHSGGSVPAAVGGFGLTAFGAGVQSYNPSASGEKKIRDDNAKLRAAYTEAVHKYLGRGVTPQLNKALRLREARETYLHKNLGSKPTARERYDAQVDLMVKMGMSTRAQAAHAKKWAAQQNDHVLRSRTSQLGHKYFGGDVLSSVAKKIRDRGGEFYLSDY